MSGVQGPVSPEPIRQQRRLPQVGGVAAGAQSHGCYRRWFGRGPAVALVESLARRGEGVGVVLPDRGQRVQWHPCGHALSPLPQARHRQCGSPVSGVAFGFRRRAGDEPLAALRQQVDDRVGTRVPRPVDPPSDDCGRRANTRVGVFVVGARHGCQHGQGGPVRHDELGGRLRGVHLCACSGQSRQDGTTCDGGWRTGRRRESGLDRAFLGGVRFDEHCGGGQREECLSDPQDGLPGLLGCEALREVVELDGH